MDNLTTSEKNHPSGIYLLKVNNRNTRTRCSIYSKLTIKTPEGRPRRRSGVFIVNFENIPQLVLVFLLLTSNMELLAGQTHDNRINFSVYHYRNSHSEVFLAKGFLKICSKFRGEHPCQKGCFYHYIYFYKSSSTFSKNNKNCHIEPKILELGGLNKAKVDLKIQKKL